MQTQVYASSCPHPSFQELRSYLIQGHFLKAGGECEAQSPQRFFQTSASPQQPLPHTMHAGFFFFFSSFDPMSCGEQAIITKMVFEDPHEVHFPCPLKAKKFCGGNICTHGERPAYHLGARVHGGTDAGRWMWSVGIPSAAAPVSL